MAIGDIELVQQGFEFVVSWWRSSGRGEVGRREKRFWGNRGGWSEEVGEIRDDAGDAPGDLGARRRPAELVAGGSTAIPTSQCPR